ncbi:MAG: glycosyltransferase family 2 protein [Syntrophorhabdaceae bacterium]
MPEDGVRQRVPVSVIIPCYRCGGSIDAALQSVVGQSALPAEVLLIDDGSLDDGRTADALHSLKGCFGDVVEIRIIIFDENRGPGFARNAGWDAATQPYVAFLDADDAWHPYKLELVFGILEKHPCIDLIGHDFSVKGDRGVRIERASADVQNRLEIKGFYSILLMNPFVTPSIVLKRSISERFNPNLRYCEDHEFLLRLSHRHHISFLNCKLVELGRAPFSKGGLTAMRTRMRMGEITMYFEALKYRRGLIAMLPALVLYSMLKHVILLGFSHLWRKPNCHDEG